MQRDTSLNILCRLMRMGANIHDLSNSGLYSCGHDIAHSRLIATSKRVLFYDRLCTRHDFEKLWKGKEDECPYWDDKPWPSSKHRRRYSYDDSDFTGCCVSDVEISEDEDETEKFGSEDDDGGVVL
jgi:hypothetical protein